jgi:hypothetical protein
MNTHLLPVPFEMAEVINSFVYYDWPTWIRLEKERLFMKDLRYRMVRWCNSPINKPDPDDFIYWLGTLDDEVQFQSSFCLKCGNYIHRYPSCTC